MGVLHSLCIKNIFYDKMYQRLFYFDLTIYLIWPSFMTKPFTIPKRYSKMYSAFCADTHNVTTF